jgi:hypothetical protein
MDDIDFLVPELAQLRQVVGGEKGLALGLAGEDEHRHRVREGAEHPVERIHSTGPGGDIEHAHGARDARVTFRSHGAGLLVMVADVAQARLARDGVVEMHRPATRDQKNVAHPVIGQFSEDVIREANHRGSFPHSPRRRKP